MARTKLPVIPERIEATDEDAAAVVARGEGIIIDGSNTGDDRDIGVPEPPMQFPMGDEVPTLPDQQVDMLGRLTSALENLSKRQDAAPADMMQAFAASMVTLAGAIERMTEGQLKGAQLVADATKKANKPSNEFPPQISAFNPRGEKDFPKPPLKCEMFIPWPAERDSLTREEVELLNLLQPGEYRVKRNDNTFVKMTVRVILKLDSDEPNRLMINHDTAFNNDYHRMMPPTDNYIRQMLKQNPKSRAAADLVLTMEEEMALIAAGKFNDGTFPAPGQKVISVGE